jgi:hypothetical protein
VQVIDDYCFSCGGLDVVLVDPGSELREVGHQFATTSIEWLGIGLLASEDDMFWSGSRVIFTEHTIDALGRFPQFRVLSSIARIEIPRTIEVIDRREFYCCANLEEVDFERGSRLCEINGFQRCPRLTKVIIPASVEIISKFGFKDCVTLREVMFEEESHMIEVEGFRGCNAIERVEKPPLCWRLAAFRVFVDYRCDDVIQSRRKVQLA